jgi:hypothetical protein
MEDALISPEGFMILSGAGLVEATSDKPIYQHMTETIDAKDVTVAENGESISIALSEVPYLPADNADNFAYVMFMKDGEIISEPYIPVHDGNTNGVKLLTIQTVDDLHGAAGDHAYTLGNVPNKNQFDSVLVDYYVARTGGAQQIEITADKFGGNYYLEAATLFRDQNGVDMPAEFIIPNCKIQSNFTFTMASSGDPSTFTFTMDAFPDYTRFDRSKKVLAAIQVIRGDVTENDTHRMKTDFATIVG